VSHRRGFTLIEMLMVILIIAMLVLIGYPKVSRAMVKTNVRGARTTLANMFAKARTVATQTNRKTRLKFSGNRVWIVASPRLLAGAGTVDTIGPVENLNTLYGVSVTSSPVVDSVTFDPRGLAGGFGATSTLKVARSGHTDSIVVDGVGRVVK
jgi:prepilin-type N-terminal cleavage/methylation domain-containing protein